MWLFQRNAQKTSQTNRFRSFEPIGTLLQCEGQALTEAECAQLAAAIQQNPQITQITFNRSQLTAQKLKILAPALKAHPGITALNFAQNALDAECMDIIVDVVNTNTHITVLGLSETDLTDEKLKSFSSKLKNRSEPFKKLYLSHNKLTTGCHTDLTTLIKTLNVQELDLSHNRGIIAHDCSFLKNLSTIPSLHTLELMACDLTPESIAALCESLRTHNTTLQSLSLDGNPIDSIAHESILKLIASTNPPLRHLGISSSGRIFDDGIVQRYLTAMRNHTTLESTSLDNCFPVKYFPEVQKIVKEVFAKNKAKNVEEQKQTIVVTR